VSYGHAAAILDAAGRSTPIAELRVAVRRLKLWADLNPKLMGLYLDFEACLRDTERYVADIEHQQPRAPVVLPYEPVKITEKKAK
jgi:hypothetical protein